MTCWHTTFRRAYGRKCETHALLQHGLRELPHFVELVHHPEPDASPGRPPAEEHHRVHQRCGDSERFVERTSPKTRRSAGAHSPKRSTSSSSSTRASSKHRRAAPTQRRLWVQVETARQTTKTCGTASCRATALPKSVLPRAARRQWRNPQPRRHRSSVRFRTSALASRATRLPRNAKKRPSA
jgi:hypothetical protein